MANLAPKYRDWLRTLGAPEDPVATDTSSEWSAMSLLKAIFKAIDDGTFLTGHIASQADAVAGTNNTDIMTPLRGAQQIATFILDEDDFLSNSADKAASQQSTKAYVDTIAATKQPVDSDLTAIAALTTTTFGRSLLELADASAAKTAIALNSVTNDAQTKAAIVPNTAPSAGQILIGNAGGTAYAKQSLSGEVTVTSAGVMTIDKSISPTWTGNHAFNGNVTFGDASNDTVTINAGTWTLANNVISTRAYGVAAAGASLARQDITTFSGDSGGTTDIRARLQKVTASGSESIAQVVLDQYQVEVQTTGGTATQVNANQSYIRLGLAGSITGGAITSARVFSVHIANEGNSNIGTAIGYFADATDLADGTGQIADNYGFAVGDLGHASRVTSAAVGFNAGNMTAGAALTAGFRAQLASGTNKYNFHAEGTADNFFEGRIKSGATAIAANGANAVAVVGSTGPVAGLAVRKWIKWLDSSGNVGYVPWYGT